MKSLRMLMCLAGSATLFGMGCGGAPEEAQVEPAPVQEEGRTVRQQAGPYQVCWPSLGIYSGPGTHYSQVYTLYHHLGDTFYEDSQVFSANGDYWIRGNGYSYSRNGWVYGYVRWAGLCH